MNATKQTLSEVPNPVMVAEATLMKAAVEFAFQWGRDQTMQPKDYWLELHLDRWSRLARAAVAYAETIEQQVKS